MDKLWRILYSPRAVFDELSGDLKTGYPLVAILGAIAVSALIIAFLAPHPSPSAEELDNYRNQLLLLADEDDREYAEQRKRELREEIYGSSDTWINSRITANPWAPFTWPLGWLLFLVLLGTSFSIVGMIIKSERTWTQWFGLVAWSNVPLILGSIVNVVLVAVDLDGVEHELFMLGDKSFYVSYAFSGSTIWWVWSLVISIHALKSWTSKGTVACVGWALLANILIFVPFLLVVFAILLAASWA